MSNDNLNGFNQPYVPFQNGLTIDEFIDSVQNMLSISGALPGTLPNANIRQIVESLAMPWFYRNYQFAVQKLYYFIDKKAFYTEEYTKYSYVTVPCEIQTVTYLYQVRDSSLFQLGINTPNMSVNMGVTNQPYLSSYVTTIGELGVYKTMLDNMSDMLNQLNKYTLKHNFNQLNHRLHILTKVENHVIMEAYANIPPQNLFRDDLFFKYVVGYSKVQLGNLVGRYDFSLPGSIKIQGSDLISQGQSEVKEVEDEIKNQSNSSWFVMVKK
jgi:hypothetical protein